MIPFRCDICKEKIGLFDPETLHLPLTSDQFDCLVQAPGHHPPFKPGMTWEWLRCPVCNRRPFNSPDKVLTDQGYVNARDIPVEPNHVDPVAEEVPAINTSPIMLNMIKPVRTFKCQYCDFEGMSLHSINIHVSKTHMQGKSGSKRKRR